MTSLFMKKCPGFQGIKATIRSIFAIKYGLHSFYLFVLWSGAAGLAYILYPVNEMIRKCTLKMEAVICMKSTEWAESIFSQLAWDKTNRPSEGAGYFFCNCFSFETLKRMPLIVHTWWEASQLSKFILFSQWLMRWWCSYRGEFNNQERLHLSQKGW